MDTARAGRLILRVSAAPEGGAANRAAKVLLAAALGVRVADIRLERGSTSRDKTLSVPGNASEALDRLLK